MRRQDELRKLSISEKQTREKMLFFKRELENRETNFNRRFNSATSGRYDIDNTVLRVIENTPNDKLESDDGSIKKGKYEKSSIGRRKRRGRATKPKRTLSTLPKIAKS